MSPKRKATGNEITPNKKLYFTLYTRRTPDGEEIVTGAGNKMGIAEARANTRVGKDARHITAINMVSAILMSSIAPGETMRDVAKNIIYNLDVFLGDDTVIGKEAQKAKENEITNLFEKYYSQNGSISQHEVMQLALNVFVAHSKKNYINSPEEGNVKNQFGKGEGTKMRAIVNRLNKYEWKLTASDTDHPRYARDNTGTKVKGSEIDDAKVDQLSSDQVSDVVDLIYKAYDYLPLNTNDRTKYIDSVSSIMRSEKQIPTYATKKTRRALKKAVKKNEGEKRKYNNTVQDQIRLLEEPIDRLYVTAARHIAIALTLCPRIQEEHQSEVIGEFIDKLADDHIVQRESDFETADDFKAELTKEIWKRLSQYNSGFEELRSMEQNSDMIRDMQIEFLQSDIVHYMNSCFGARDKGFFSMSDLSQVGRSKYNEFIESILDINNIKKNLKGNEDLLLEKLEELHEELAMARNTLFQQTLPGETMEIDYSVSDYSNAIESIEPESVVSDRFNCEPIEDVQLSSENHGKVNSLQQTLKFLNGIPQQDVMAIFQGFMNNDPDTLQNYANMLHKRQIILGDYSEDKKDVKLNGPTDRTAEFKQFFEQGDEACIRRIHEVLHPRVELSDDFELVATNEVNYPDSLCGILGHEGFADKTTFLLLESIDEEYLSNDELFVSLMAMIQEMHPKMESGSYENSDYSDVFDKALEMGVKNTEVLVKIFHLSEETDLRENLFSKIKDRDSNQFLDHLKVNESELYQSFMTWHANHQGPRGVIEDMDVDVSLPTPTVTNVSGYSVNGASNYKFQKTLKNKKDEVKCNIPPVSKRKRRDSGLPETHGEKKRKITTDGKTPEVLNAFLKKH